MPSDETRSARVPPFDMIVISPEAEPSNCPASDGISAVSSDKSTPLKFIFTP